MVRVGVLTGGGDAPGLNAAIRAVVRRTIRIHGGDVVGFHDGWRGVVEGHHRPLDIDACRGILPRGGTILGTSRETPFSLPDGVERARVELARLGIDGVVVIGGEGSLSAAHELHQIGFDVVGVPKTIDNDIAGTNRTFGFDTAVGVAAEAIDRLHTTAEAHDRVMVVEVMGRHAGHIAIWAGIAGGAAVVLGPEEPFDIEAVADTLRRRHENGRWASVVVVAEGAFPVDGTMPAPVYDVDQFGHRRLGGIGVVLADEIQRRTGFETRVTILGHVQRGGTPTAFDRVLATWFGVVAADAVAEGDFGTMTAYRNGLVVRLPLAEAHGQIRLVAPELLDVARTFLA